MAEAPVTRLSHSPVTSQGRGILVLADPLMVTRGVSGIVSQNKLGSNASGLDVK